MDKTMALRLLKEGKITQCQYDKIMDILEGAIEPFTPSSYNTPGRAVYGDYGNRA